MKQGTQSQYTGTTQWDGMGWGGRLEEGSGWGTHVHPWMVHNSPKWEATIGEWLTKPWCTYLPCTIAL